MSGKLEKLMRNPGRYLPMIRRMFLQPLCPLFSRTAFFLQGQMDISPRSRWYDPDFSASTGGFYPAGQSETRRICDLEAHDNTRRDMLALLLRTIVTKDIPGAFAEVGVFQGRTARLIHHYAPERALHLFDTFAGFTERGAALESQSTGTEVSPTYFANTSLPRVRAYIEQRSENVFFHPGFFPESIPAALTQESFAFAHLDADLYEPIIEGLKFFYPRMARHGFIVVHDYNAWLGARKAVDEFFADKSELPVPMPDKSGSVLIVKQ
jgi:O-methyltransferase